MSIKIVKSLSSKVERGQMVILRICSRIVKKVKYVCIKLEPDNLGIERRLLDLTLWL